MSYKFLLVKYYKMQNFEYKHKAYSTLLQLQEKRNIWKNFFLEETGLTFFSISCCTFSS